MLAETAAAPWTEDDIRVLQIMANVLTGQRHEDRAVVLLEYAHEKAPVNVEVKRALCGVYLLLRRHEEALAMAEQLLPADADGKTRAVLQLVRAKALWGLGREPEAQAAMQDYMTIRQKR